MHNTHIHCHPKAKQVPLPLLHSCQHQLASCWLVLSTPAPIPAYQHIQYPHNTLFYYLKFCFFHHRPSGSDAYINFHIFKSNSRRMFASHVEDGWFAWKKNTPPHSRSCSYVNNLSLFPQYFSLFQSAQTEAHRSLNLSSWKRSSCCVNITLLPPQVIVLLCVCAGVQHTHLLLCTLLWRFSCCIQTCDSTEVCARKINLDKKNEVFIFLFSYRTPLDTIWKKGKDKVHMWAEL